MYLGVWSLWTFCAVNSVICHTWCCCVEENLLICVRESISLEMEIWIESYHISYYNERILYCHPWTTWSWQFLSVETSFLKSDSEPYIKSWKHSPAFQNIKNCVFHSLLTSLTPPLLFLTMLHFIFHLHWIIVGFKFGNDVS